MSVEAMNHDVAVKSMAAERYLLREMTGPEREAFEGHYLGCPECFEAVTFTFEFAAAAKEALRERVPAYAAKPVAGPKEAVGGGWMAWLFRPQLAATFALLLLGAVGVNLYQLRTNQELKGPQIESRSIIPGASRASAKVITVPRDSRITLEKEFIPSDEFGSYEVQIVSEDEKVAADLPFKLQPSQELAAISLYAATLKPGDYSIVVQGVTRDGAKKELARGSFDLQFAK